MEEKILDNLERFVKCNKEYKIKCIDKKCFKCDKDWNKEELIEAAREILKEYA